MAQPKASAGERFADLIEPYVDFVAWAARKYAGPADDAEDLAQEALLRAYRGIDKFDGRYPKAWLATIVRNTAITRTQRRRDEVVLDMEAPTEAGGPPLAVDDHSPEDTIVDDLLEGPVERALADLSPEFRETVEAVDVMGMPYKEAAAYLGVPVGTIMSRLHRARGRLRESILAAEAEAFLAGQDPEVCLGC